MSKKRVVKSYPTWKQIAFDDVTVTRGEFKVTEKLLNAPVEWARANNPNRPGEWLRLRVRGKRGENK